MTTSVECECEKAELLPTIAVTAMKKTSKATKPRPVKITQVDPKEPNKVNVVVQMQKVTTVHGTSQFGSKRGKGLILWCAILLGNVALTAYFLTVIEAKFNENQIFTQVNANCKISQVPFPAVSVCNFNLVSVKESANIANILKENNVPKDDMEDFFNSLHYLTSYNKYSRNLRNFTGIMNILKRHYFTMDTIMEEVHQKCENLFLYCSFNRKQKRCADIFILTKTIDGYCCSFNYVGLNEFNQMSSIHTDRDFEYYDDPNDESINLVRRSVIMTSESGSSTGLSLVLNVEPNDYPSFSKIPYYGAKILISDPYDYPETSIVYRYISLGEWVEIKVEAMLFQSSSELRRVSPEKRSCWFYDEIALDHTDRYSHETCNTECKMKMYIENCGCVPFKYPREKSFRVCELDDLKCLNNVTVHKSVKDMNCDYVCYMECRDKRYIITSDLAPFVDDEFPPNITENKNKSELAALQVYYGKSNCNCYKKNLLTDINYFIATYGGVFSLSFGASILTLFEFSFIFSTATAKSIWRAITNVYSKYKR